MSRNKDYWNNIYKDLVEKKPTYDLLVFQICILKDNN